MIAQGPAVPDALWLEVLDLLGLCFPRPVATAVIGFGPTDDGSGACLTELEGEAPDESPARPDLGHPDDEVLDTLNAIVSEIVPAFAEAGGPLLSRGSIRVQPGDDDGVVVTLESHAAGDDVRAPGRVHLSHRFSPSELLKLVHTPPLFAALNDTEAAERAAEEAMAALRREAVRFSLDVDSAALTLMDEQSSMRTLAAQLLGTWHEGSRTFLWGWANEALPAPFRARIEEVRREATAPGLRALHQGELLCPARMAERLCAHAAVKLEATGTWELPAMGRQGDVRMFLALWDRS